MSTAAQADPERLICVGRLLISSFALGAVYLDPTQPANLVSEAYSILLGYVLLSVALLFVRPPKSLDAAYKLITTAVDVGIVAVLVYITDELESPFLTFYTFLLISAAIRWEWAGTLVTAAILQAILITIGVSDLADGESELNFLIIRSVFCWVIVLMLGYFGSYRSRSNRRLRELASWPNDIVPEEDRPWLTSSLGHASMVLGAETIIVIWRDRDETLEHAAVWHGRACRFLDQIEIPEQLWRPVEGDETTELSASRDGDLLAALGTVLGFPNQSWRDVFATEFGTIRFVGSVIVIDPAVRDSDTILLTQIVASRIAMELEQFVLVREYASAAGLKERDRLARDLHDSILQDLTATVLQIDSSQRTGIDSDQTLSQVREILLKNQREVRLLVEDARRDLKGRRQLADLFQMFVEPLSAQWGCRVRLDIEPPDLKVSETIATELCLTLSEATANAARHGGATDVRVSVRRRQGRLEVIIEDDGTGGRAADIPHPASIDSRIRDMGGSLAIGREKAGLKLHIALPLEQL